MKFETLIQSFVVFFCASLELTRAQSWPSYSSQKDVNTPVVNNFVEPVDVRTENPRLSKNVEGTGQTMYYYETYPANPSALQQGRRRPNKSASFYPSTYEGNNNGYYRPEIGNRQAFGGGTGPTGATGDDGVGGGADGGGLAGLAGLLGLLGLKGLKGLATLAPLAIAVPFLPILLPLLLAPILLPLIALLLFIPIPVIVTPGGRSFAGGVVEFSERAFKLTKLFPDMAAEVLQSEECLERISCEVARVSRKLHLEGMVQRITSSLPQDNKYTKKILEGIKSKPAKASARKTSEENADCSIHACKAKSILAKHFTKL